jgi:hypothetical protein
LQSDPIGNAGSVNTYAYTNGNPVMMVDPLGLSEMLCNALESLPDYIKGQLELAAGAVLGVAGGLTLSNEGVAVSGFIGLSGGAKASWKPDTELLGFDPGWSTNVGGTEGGTHIGTSLKLSLGIGPMANGDVSFGTNGVTASVDGSIGVGAFAGLGFSGNGTILDCSSGDEEC